jgi:glycosyltransferase involved in cell wall biosynthesis
MTLTVELWNNRFLRGLMRVLQLIDNLHWGGAQKMVSMLAYELVARQVQVVVAGLDADDIDAYYAQVLRSYGIDIVTVAGPLFDLKRIGNLIRFIRHGNFDLVQTHLSYANMVGVLAGRLAGLPVIVTLHSTGVDRRYYHPVRYRLETMALRCPGCHIVAVGYTVAEMQQSRVGRKKDIKVVPNAMTIFPELHPLEKQKLRLGLIGRDEGPVLISVGRLSPDKGYADMITAFAITVRDYPTACLIIVGEGVMTDSLKSQTRSLDIEQNIFFLGARDDVPKLLKASDMYVSASHREGMSMSLLEAMAAGLPTVATRVGDAPKMFTEGSGVLVQPEDPNQLAKAINSLLADPARMREMGRAAGERVVTKFGLKAWADEYINLYRNILRLE